MRRSARRLTLLALAGTCLALAGFSGADYTATSANPGSTFSTLDYAPPTITAKPSTPSANTNPSFSFTHTSYSSFQCQLDGGSFHTCTSGNPVGSISGVHPPLSNGSHTFVVEAVGPNNLTTNTASYTWTIDATAPTIGTKPSNPSANSSPSISFTHGTYTGFKCKLDAGSFAACTSPDALGTLADGSHTLTVEAIDADGAATSTSAYTWTINTAGPTLGTKPSNPSANTGPSFSYTDGTYANTQFQCQLDGAGFAGCPSPKSLSSLSAASHTFDVKAVDADGNSTGTTSYTWTIDTSAPSITAKPSNPSASTGPSFSFSHTQGAYTFKCKLDAGSFATCASPDALSGLSGAGASGTSHTFTVEALGTDGVATSTTAYVWTIKSGAPTVTGQPATPTNNTSASFNLSDTLFSSFACQLDGGGFSSCTSPAAYSGLSGAGQTGTSHTFQVHSLATDGSTTSNFSYTWTVDTTAPTITIAACTGGSGHKNNSTGTTNENNGTVSVAVTGPNPGTTLRATLTASTFGGVSPNFTWTTNDTGNALTTGSTYHFSATQTDAAGNVSSASTRDCVAN
jgi:hypothetical protein